MDKIEASADDISAHQAIDDPSTASGKDESRGTRKAEKVARTSLARNNTADVGRSNSGTLDQPPPDGGARAWIQVFCAHLTLFNTFGYISAFGVFQTYYQSTLKLSPSTISWIGSIQIFLLFAGGVFSGAATDRGYFRHVYIAGSILQIVGIFTQAESHKYWHLFVTQGLTIGVSNALQFCPVMSLTVTYFAKRRAFVLGIVAVGACSGGVVFPLIVQQLMPKIGYKWTVRVIGFIMFVFNSISALLLRPRLKPREDSITLVDWAAFHDWAFVLYSIAMFLIFWSLYFAFFYIGVYGRGLGMTYGNSVNLLLVTMCPGFIFRLAPAFLADKIGPLNTLVPMTIVCSVAMFAWTGIHSVSGIYTFAAIYGSASACIQALWIAPINLLNRVCNLQKAGARIGMISTIVAFASLTGPPLAGALIREEAGDYMAAQVWAGLSFALGVRRHHKNLRVYS